MQFSSQKLCVFLAIILKVVEINILLLTVFHCLLKSSVSKLVQKEWQSLRGTIWWMCHEVCS